MRQVKRTFRRLKKIDDWVSASDAEDVLDGSSFNEKGSIDPESNHALLLYLCLEIARYRFNQQGILVRPNRT